MTVEELKHILRSAEFAQKSLENELDKLQELRSLAERMTSCYRLAPGGSSTGGSLENAVVKISAQKQEIIRDCDRLCQKLHEVRKLIALLPDGMMKVIMQRRYTNYQKWEQIAADLGYSWRQIHRLHSKALKLILLKEQ